MKIPLHVVKKAQNIRRKRKEVDYRGENFLIQVYLPNDE